jgi:hypothetical protein
MAGGPVTRMLLRLRQSGSLESVSTAASRESAGKVVRGASEIASGMAIDDAALDRLAATAASGPATPRAFERLPRR